MKKTILFLMCALFFVASYGQKISYPEIEAKTKFWLSGKYVTAISDDSSMAARSLLKIPTEYAVYWYVTHHAGNGAASLRFGVSGEDVRSLANRYFSLAGYNMTYDSGNLYVNNGLLSVGGRFKATTGQTYIPADSLHVPVSVYVKDGDTVKYTTVEALEMALASIRCPIPFAQLVGNIGDNFSADSALATKEPLIASAPADGKYYGSGKVWRDIDTAARSALKATYNGTTNIMTFNPRSNLVLYTKGLPNFDTTSYFGGIFQYDGMTRGTRPSNGSGTVLWFIYNDSNYSNGNNTEMQIAFDKGTNGYRSRSRVSGVWNAWTVGLDSVTSAGLYAGISHTHTVSQITDAGDMALQNKTAVDIRGGNMFGMTRVQIPTLAAPVANGDVSINSTSKALQFMQGGIVYSSLTAANNLSELAAPNTALTNLGGTTAGVNLFKLANPSAVSFIRINADNTPSTRTSAQMLGDLVVGNTISGLGEMQLPNATTLPNNGSIAINSTAKKFIFKISSGQYTGVTAEVANDYTAGAKQTFSSDATNAGLRFGGGITANPSSLATGDIWYRTDENKFRYYDGSTVRAFVSEALAQQLTNKDLTSGTNTFPTFNQNTTGSAAKWTTPRTLAMTGDLAYSVSVDGSANVTGAGTIQPQAVTYAKIQNLSAQTMLVNNTASAASAQEIPFKQVFNSSYSGTLTGTGTMPSGTANLIYSWTQTGKMVQLSFSFLYVTAGTTVTQMNFTLPTDMPAPSKPNGYTSANEIVAAGGGEISTGTTPSSTSNVRVMLANDAANTGTLLIFNMASASVKGGQCNITYYSSVIP